MGAIARESGSADFEAGLLRNAIQDVAERIFSVLADFLGAFGVVVVKDSVRTTRFYQVEVLETSGRDDGKTGPE